jgi:death on curing protein
MFDDELALADFLLIGESILGIPAEDLVRVTNIPAAESALAAPFANYGGVYFYPDPVVRGALCASRVVRNHPLLDGNKRVAYECMVEMYFRSGTPWPEPGKEGVLIAMMVEGLAASSVSENDFISWAKERSAP